MNGKLDPRLAACAALLFAAMAPAQMRQPFTGVVRDGAGKPIAGAQVVCEWRPDGIELGEPDRREAASDAEGRFALELWIGRAYCVWAIGPADAAKQRLVVPPSFVAVGGRQLDLVASATTSPARLRVSGAQPWLDVGPLALRIHVSTLGALPDLVIPGDGAVPLPPLPTPRLTVFLLDQKRQVLARQDVDLRETDECAFVEPQDVEFVATDEDGKPVAGARILHHGWATHAIAPAVPKWGGIEWPDRVVAVTGADGHARGRIVRVERDTSTVFRAATDDRESNLCGWWSNTRLEDGRVSNADPEVPFTFLMRPRERTTVRIVGATPDLLLHACLSGTFRMEMAQMSANMPFRTATSRVTSDVFADRIGTADVVAVRLHGIGTATQPLRAAIARSGPAPKLEDIDLSLLRPIAVAIVDASGKPVPFAACAVTHQLQGIPILWSAHLVSDGEGRGAFRLPTEPCLFYAWTADAHGFVEVKDSAVGDARIVLETFVTARCRVLDGDDKPVAGARIEVAQSRSADKGLAWIAAWGTTSSLSNLETDEQGEVELRFPKQLEGAQLNAKLRSATSEPGALRAGETTTLRLAR